MYVCMCDSPAIAKHYFVVACRPEGVPEHGCGVWMCACTSVQEHYLARVHVACMHACMQSVHMHVIQTPVIMAVVCVYVHTCMCAYMCVSKLSGACLYVCMCAYICSVYIVYVCTQGCDLWICACRSGGMNMSFVCEYMRVRVRVNVYVCEYLCARTHTCFPHAKLWPYIHTHIHLCVYTYIHNIYIYIYIYIYMHVYTHVYTHLEAW